MTTTTDHAQQNAQQNAISAAASICELYRAVVALLDRECEQVEIDGEMLDDVDDVIQRANEMPLAVEIRSAWTSPGTELAAAEYQIVLTAGGPACRITGDIDGPARLEYCDWGTFWRQAYPDDDDWDDAVEWFVNLFALDSY